MGEEWKERMTEEQSRRKGEEEKEQAEEKKKKKLEEDEIMGSESIVNISGEDIPSFSLNILK